MHRFAMGTSGEHAASSLQSSVARARDSVDSSEDATARGADERGCGPVSVPLSSDGYRDADLHSMIQLAPAPKRHCKLHGRYHVCEWTRLQREQEKCKPMLAQGLDAAPGDDSHGPTVRQPCGDIEDVPPPLKRFAKRAQVIASAQRPSLITPCASCCLLVLPVMSRSTCILFCQQNLHQILSCTRCCTARTYS